MLCYDIHYEMMNEAVYIKYYEFWTEKMNKGS